MQKNDIEQKRQQLINTVNQHGLSSTKALLCSEELDQLLHQYQQAQVLSTHYKLQKMTHKNKNSPLLE